MKNFTSFKFKLAVASVVVLVATKYAKADLLIYEGFDYTTGVASGSTLDGAKLDGQSSGIGLAGSWAKYRNVGCTSSRDFTW